MASSNSNIDVGKQTLAEMRAWHLFIVPGEINSQKAISASRLLNEVYQLDIRTLQTLPGFIRGVPTLYQKKEGNVFEGTQCLEILSDMARSATIPSSQMTGLQSFGDARDLISTSGSGVNSFDGGSSGSITETPKEKITDDDVNTYMQLRASTNRATMERIKNKNQIPVGSNRMPAEVARKVLAR